VDRDAWITVAAVATGIVSVARLTRLGTHDKFPPAVWLRLRYMNLTRNGEWSALAECPFCLAPWLMLGVGLWGYLSGPDLWWWLFNGWLAASYVASMVVLRDEPPD